MFAHFIVQVNKVALHFRDATAIWWQNLKDKLYTWEDLDGVAEMEVDEDTPGWDAVPPRRGLKTLLLKRFQSQTHIADARKTLNEMSFDTRGKEDIEAFAAKMDAQLNIVGILYDEDNLVTNGIRVEYLLKALPL